MKKFLFAPFMMNLGESQRLSQIAEVLQSSGHEIHILGEVYYPFLFNDDSYIFHYCDYDSQVYCKERYSHFCSFDMDFNFLSDEEINNLCNYERDLLKKYQFDAVFTGYRLSIVVSCKIEKTPLIWVISGSVEIDEIIRNIDGIIPYRLKINANDEKARETIKHVVLSYSKSVGTWNKYIIAAGAPPMRTGLELFIGDLNLIADYSKFYNFDLQSNYKLIGPILFSSKKSNFSVLKGEKKVLLSFGTSFNKLWLKKFVATLPKGFSYILTTCGEDIQIDREDVQLIDFADFNTLGTNILFAIIHGGQGTVYDMARQAIPFIGIPFFNEQLWNIKKFENQGAAILLNENESEIEDIVSKFYEKLEIYTNNMLEISQEILNESKRSLKNIVEVVDDFFEKK